MLLACPSRRSRPSPPRSPSARRSAPTSGRAASASGCSQTGSAGTRWAPSAGFAPGGTTVSSWWPPVCRCGCSASRPSTRCCSPRAARCPSGCMSGAAAPSRRRVICCSSPSTWTTACRGGGGAWASPCCSARSRCATAPPASRSWTGSSPGRRCGCPTRRCARGGTATASASATGRSGCDPSPRGSSCPAATGSAGRGTSRPASGTGPSTRAEAARGLNPEEDLWFAGRFVTELTPGEALQVVAWAPEDAPAPPEAEDILREARQRSRRLVVAAGAEDAVTGRLTLAADAFVVQAAGSPEVVAGYPWFGAWSRDTMTSYEGLFLETGRSAEGAALLRQYASTVSEGMLANTADTGTLEYNTADASLWFVHALGRHAERTGEDDLAVATLPVVNAIIAAHRAGTRYGIAVDPGDGLLTQGASGYALTWMDARVDGIPVTHRAGKAVELNALWVRSLTVAAALRGLAGQAADDLWSLDRQARASFTLRFLRGDGALYDVVDGPGGDDASVRPNMLLAASLPGGPVADGAVVHAAAPLLTPIGLRSLAPDEPAYHGRHRGGPAERDQAYHQGAVWPWLLGPYVDAALRTGVPVGDPLCGLRHHLSEWGIGSVSETADGDPPHGGTGCPFQAWSVAETLRVWRRLHATESAPATSYLPMARSPKPAVPESTRPR